MSKFTYRDISKKNLIRKEPYNLEDLIAFHFLYSNIVRAKGTISLIPHDIIDHIAIALYFLEDRNLENEIKKQISEAELTESEKRSIHSSYVTILNLLSQGALSDEIFDYNIPSDIKNITVENAKSSFSKKIQQYKTANVFNMNSMYFRINSAMGMFSTDLATPIVEIFLKHVEKNIDQLIEFRINLMVKIGAYLEYRLNKELLVYKFNPDLTKKYLERFINYFDENSGTSYEDQISFIETFNIDKLVELGVLPDPVKRFFYCDMCSQEASEIEFGVSVVK